jgi:CheY-like chemotaxis protein
MTALIIDDNGVVRDFLRLKFEAIGWKVVTAKNAYEGLLSFRDSLPRLVTIDLLMPINNGLDSLQLINMMRDEQPKAIILVVSSFAPKPDLQGFFRGKGIELFDKANPENPRFDQLMERVGSLFAELSANTQ